jgi:hypothetical protein
MTDAKDIWTKIVGIVGIVEIEEIEEIEETVRTEKGLIRFHLHMNDEADIKSALSFTGYGVA